LVYIFVQKSQLGHKIFFSPKQVHIF